MCQPIYSIRIQHENENEEEHDWGGGKPLIPRDQPRLGK